MFGDMDCRTASSLFWTNAWLGKEIEKLITPGLSSRPGRLGNLHIMRLVMNYKVIIDRKRMIAGLSMSGLVFGLIPDVID